MSARFHAAMSKSIADEKMSIREWIDDLRRKEIRAAHPDDGWVNRERNEVVLQYPDFNDGIHVGGMIAIGWPNSWRKVRVVSRRTSPFGITYWKFEDVPDVVK